MKRTLAQLLLNQAEGLKRYQSASGMWHTLIDEPSSYAEASATCGFAYGLLRAVHTGLIDASWEAVARCSIVVKKDRDRGAHAIK